MKRFALLLTFLWWAQFPVCVLADGGGHAHGEAAQEATAAEHHHTGQDSAPPIAPEREGGPSSCADHCASLARAMPGQAATPAPGVTALMILSPGTSFISHAPNALAVRSAPERLPPDRPLRTTILRL